MLRVCSLILFALAAGIAAAQSASPCAGQQSRDVKALSQQEVDDLAAGRDMGLAKAAELNRYPGPAHVIAMRDALGLSDDPSAKSEAVFERMQSHAIALGSALIAEERALLSAEQTGRYNELRGYATASGDDARPHVHH